MISSSDYNNGSLALSSSRTVLAGSSNTSTLYSESSSTENNKNINDKNSSTNSNGNPNCNLNNINNINGNNSVNGNSTINILNGNINGNNGNGINGNNGLNGNGNNGNGLNLNGLNTNNNPKWNQYMNLDKARNAINVIGEPVDKVIEILKDIDPYSETSVKGTVVKIRMDVFDELDDIVFSYLKDAYFESFKASYWWTKHFQYLCLTERKVVEDDFAIFRGNKLINLFIECNLIWLVCFYHLCDT